MASNPVEPFLGIMTHDIDGIPPFGEAPFCARLCRLGRGLGLQVYVFSPLWVDPERMQVRGFTISRNGIGWEEGIFPLPDLIYDRSFFVNRSDYLRHKAAVRRLQQLKATPCLGHGLKSKWEALVYLGRDPELRPYLPKTVKLARPGLPAEWLRTAERVFLKPLSGSQGKGAAMAERLPSGYRVRARDSTNRSIERTFRDSAGLTAWIRSFTGNRKYLLQQYLELQSGDGTAWDVRSLVQKNGQGLWELTGMAVRLGGTGSITSNLHGGGDAFEVLPFLERQFGSDRAADIAGKLRFLSERIPPALEASNGRMAELGIDLGVDRNGRVWIIEVNTKPGRSVFHRLQQRQESYRAALHPVAYAKHLLRAGSGAAAYPQTEPYSRPLSR
ncbi:YheC/YheD family endospore coat-associated protein [Gorillibacterium sp. sgz5001074]|uniref:YheC/YheD family endospore coat-associated protein n=1 Tax=Gorillibacterium sp. sgz5001074 TaxID=3446695 RepID=UPI003F67976C